MSVLCSKHLASNPCQTKWPVYQGGHISESRNSESLRTVCLLKLWHNSSSFYACCHSSQLKSQVVRVVFLPLCQYLSLCHQYYIILCHACNWFHVLLQLHPQCHPPYMGDYLRWAFIAKTAFTMGIKTRWEFNQVDT